ncbi:MAG: hypothetical protein HON02_00575 [Rhodospirillaceae bacterium]|nr:hypothetical protein [Rhodospirillaceae bacterium]
MHLRSRLHQSARLHRRHRDHQARPETEDAGDPVGFALDGGLQGQDGLADLDPSADVEP